MDTTVSAGHHLEITSIFAIVLIYIKVDASIDNEGLTNDHILRYIFPDERTLTFDEKVSDVFGTFRDHSLITNLAIPFLINILREPLFFNSMITAVFILSKDLLPQSKLQCKNSFSETFSTFKDLIKHEIHKNSIIGKFLHSAYLVYTGDPLSQENYNFEYLERLGSFDTQHALKCLLEYEHRSMIAKILFCGDNLKTFQQFKTDHFDSESIQSVYLHDLLQAPDNKLQQCSYFHTEMGKKATIAFHNKQDIKDFFFSRLDCCSNQFEVLNLLHSVICHEVYNKNMKFLLDVLTTLIDSGKFDGDSDISTDIYSCIHILLGLEPGLRDSGLVSKSIHERITGILESIVALTNKGSHDLPVNCVSFLFAETKLEAYEGDFQRAYNVILLATKLRLQKSSQGLSSGILKLEPISYFQAKRDLFLSMGYGYDQETYENPVFKINQYKPRCDEGVFIYSGITVKDSEILSSLGGNSTEQDLNYWRYNRAKLLASQKMFIEAIHEIDVAVEGTDNRNYMWIFEFKLLKCLIFEESCNNAAKAMRMYHETFIDNEAYMESLDLYRKLLVGAYYILFTQKSSVSENSAFRFYYQYDTKVKLFKNTRLINVWDDIYANL